MFAIPSPSTKEWETNFMILSIDHIGIVVKDLQKAIRLLENLGLTVSDKEEIGHLKVEVAFFQISGNRIELISPLTENHELMRHIQEHGEGLHHIAFYVREINEAVENLKKLGIRIALDRPKGKGHGGKEIVFLNSEDTNGILIELCQEKR
jgi:methylmalonyl-CoA/ethylmalonyl-CoA epimerase